MNKRVRLTLLAVAAAAPVAAMVVMTGCDEMPRSTFALTPDYAELTPGSNFVAITVATNNQATLQLPIAWHVADPALGTIQPRQGFDALYVRSGAGGVNRIVATDRAGNEGYASVKQTAERYPLTITASPATIPFVSGALVTLTVAPPSGEAPALPYEWTVSDPNAGVIDTGNGGASVVFRTRNNGYAAILVRDANGVTAAIALAPDFP